MKLTNKMNLPDALYQAVKNDPYSSGDADYSVTDLLKPPRQLALFRENQNLVEEDASERIWSLLGQVVHGILERANTKDVSERRLSAVIDGVKISGGMDLYSNGILQDFKFVTAYKFKDSFIPIEYEQQLNMYAEILRQNNHPVHMVQIVGILRDWSKLESRREPTYPQSQVVIRTAKLWPQELTQAFIKHRISLHQAAKNELPECSKEERWARPTVYAVMKTGREKAIKLYNNKEDAESHASTDALLRVDTRPGESIRCAAYCSVSNFCSQNLGKITKGDVA